uniref:Uncharacterized protein n=1 Tax=Rhizophora mucronata TaxID=61149 RepID=A0A2P2NBF5_RHIMU
MEIFLSPPIRAAPPRSS